jgi:hypothetical protein
MDLKQRRACLIRSGAVSVSPRRPIALMESAVSNPNAAVEARIEGCDEG